jgi:hypothetical protein
VNLAEIGLSQVVDSCGHRNEVSIKKNNLLIACAAISFCKAVYL